MVKSYIDLPARGRALYHTFLRRRALLLRGISLPNISVGEKGELIKLFAKGIASMASTPEALMEADNTIAATRWLIAPGMILLGADISISFLRLNDMADFPAEDYIIITAPRRSRERSVVLL
mgnify:CR=1 FL=1